MTSVMVFANAFPSMVLLVFYNKDGNTNEESDHQQNRYNTCDYNCVHIHSCSPAKFPIRLNSDYAHPSLAVLIYIKPETPLQEVSN